MPPLFTRKGASAQEFMLRKKGDLSLKGEYSKLAHEQLIRTKLMRHANRRQHSL
jgi:hypothetical protein